MSDSANIIFVGNTGFEADPDRLIVLQDEHKSGYECPTCGDKEHRTKSSTKSASMPETESIIDCENCKGMGFYFKPSLDENKAGTVKVFCSRCDRTGKVACPECDGKGSKTIVIPDSTKGRPTTGVVVSCGANVKNYQLGDRVCYPSFAGHAFDLTGVDAEGKTVERTLVIHIERDILAKVHGTLEKRMVKQSAALHTLA